MGTPRYIVLEKPVGQTPLEAIQEWRKMNPPYADASATYAGRLDPMASGKLLVLLGEECARRDAYTGLDKEYEIQVVLDFSTDTGDALGLPSASERETHPDSRELQRALASLTGAHSVPYPPFSSKTVNGKPLFEYALAGTLNTSVIPEHDEHVYRITMLRTNVVSAAELRERVQETLRTVPQSEEFSKKLGADFRQDEIRIAWEALFDTIPTEGRFAVLSLRVTCASGTYMRTLAGRLGAALETSGFALSIHRTKIGRYVPLGSLGFWLKTY